MKYNFLRTIATMLLLVFFEGIQGMTQATSKVHKYTLKNGLVLLICQKKFASQVALQMWYNVGSKHEQPREKGMAHFIEHMIFKGTHEMLSESDINAVSQKLSAYCNAFTSWDYTGYVFDVPVANWQQVLPIFADCMQNCRFDQEHMNSEVKAVIQELKMYRDQYSWVLREALMPVIFEEHPYHYPIIGYKQDLWDMKQEDLVRFYKKYYQPNNACLVIVGDVEPDEAFALVEKEFELIPAGTTIERPNLFLNDKFESKIVTVYRDVDQSLVKFAFEIPGFTQKLSYFFEIIASVLAKGKSSRLHKRLIDDLQIATSTDAGAMGLVDKDLFFISVVPKNENVIDQIRQVVLEEINALAYGPISDQELRRAIKFAQVDRQHLRENVHEQASEIGYCWTTIQDPEYPFTADLKTQEEVHQQIVALLQEYFRPAICHQASLLKVSKQDLDYLNRMQEKSDALDTQILFGKERTNAVEPECYVNKIQVLPYEKKPFPKSKEHVLSNGLKVLLYDNPEIDLIECCLQLKADRYYDPADMQGLSLVISRMMLEGTKNYPGSKFVQEADSYGISILSGFPGEISMSVPASDMEKSFELLGEMLNNAELSESNLKKIIDQIKQEIIQFWDNPSSSIAQVAAEKIYKNHPYAKMLMGTQESLSLITPKICKQWYDSQISANGATLAVVGNLKNINIVALAEKYLGSWRNTLVSNVQYPIIDSVKPQVYAIEKNRDQIVLAFAGLSVDRMHPDYDALTVFNKILAEGMSSKLFELREQTGLFYTIGGSVVARSAEQSGLIFIKTIVSKDRLEEAQKVIAQCLNTAVDTVTQQEFEQAQEVLVNSFAMNFETNLKTASAFLFLEKYKLDKNYFENRIDTVRALTLSDMKNIVKKYLSTDKLITIKIGRL
ncbi:insulinase family protein [Candidatus Babeliales bacterium]|nr:insulinase family protein [Candidatus Babeliales bacterium]